MSHNLTLAQNHAFDLARTLMVPVVLFEVDDEFGVMVSSEYDGEQDAIVHDLTRSRLWRADTLDSRPIRQSAVRSARRFSCRLHIIRGFGGTP